MKVSNFYDFQIIQENTSDNLNIGDYVILIDGPQLWQNLYGTIKDKGRFNYSKSDDLELCLISILSELSSEQKKFIIGQNINDRDVISLLHKKIEKYDTWVHEMYLVKYNTKKEFDEAVQEIESKKSANKYNL